VAGLIDIRVRGQRQVIEAMTAVNRDADRAQQTALRAAMRSARTATKKEAAARLGVPQKIFRRRIATYVRRPKRIGERRGVLWGGLRREPRAVEHPAVARAILVQKPTSFWATFRGERKLVQRRGGKLRDAFLDLDHVFSDILPREARRAMDERYVPVLIRDFDRRVQNRLRRR